MEGCLSRLSQYIELGYRLIPLKPNSKEPLIKGWPEKASSDPKQIEAWARAYPGCNWGLVPDEPTLVLDVDDTARLGDLLATHPELDEAPRQRTPRGGAHILLRIPPDLVGKTPAKVKWRDGVDLRGLGRSYIVVAPSTIDGKTYTWERPLVAAAELPEVPLALLQELPKKSEPAPTPAPTPPPTAGVDPSRLEPVRRALRRICEVIARTPEGQRHNKLLRAAHKVGGWLVHGLDPEEARQALIEAALQAGLPLGEARRTVEDGLRVGGTKPLPPPTELAISYARPLGSQGAGSSHPLEGLAGGGEVLEGVPRYVVKDGVIQAGRVEGGGVVYWPLANFAARIRREVRASDGLEEETLFELEGYLADGTPLPRALVPASEFAGMGWVHRVWGGRAVVSAGQGNKDHLRAAIQLLSLEGYEQATVYRHLGWTKIGGRWHYLHAGGAIADGAPEPVEVELRRVLEGFVLPDPPEGDEERERIRDLWKLTEVAPPRVTVPLLLYALGAPLGPAPFSLYLAGPTGARKTSLALVLQSLFGHTAPYPPVGWEATPNALEGAAFAAKDALLLVDDFAPTGTEKAQQEFRGKAARILRSQGNGTGRLRMRADGSLAGDKPPRGSLLITGEDLPPGHSVRARALFLELSRGEVNLRKLSEAQKLARRKVYAQAMAAWIRWLARDLEAHQARLQDLVEELRPRWDAEHGRTTDALARLHAVWLLYKEYAASRGVKLEELEETVLQALEAVREAQAGFQRDADPVQRFLSLLYTALRMGRAHMVPLTPVLEDDVDRYLPNPTLWGWRYRHSSEAWEPQGPRIGWVPPNWETKGIYLDPSAAWGVVNELAKERGEALPTERTLWKALAAAGAIRTVTEAGKVRYQVRLRVDYHTLVRAVHILPPYVQGGGGKTQPGGAPTPPSEPQTTGGARGLRPQEERKGARTGGGVQEGQGASRPHDRDREREAPQPPSKPQEGREASRPPVGPKPQPEPPSRTNPPPWNPWAVMLGRLSPVVERLEAMGQRGPHLLEVVADGEVVVRTAFHGAYRATLEKTLVWLLRKPPPERGELWAVWPGGRRELLLAAEAYPRAERGAA